MARQALLIVDHGSKRHESNEMLKFVRVKVKELAPDLIVNVAHMELAEPTIPQGFEACVKEGATEIVVLPYMLGPGKHSTGDIPRMVSEAAASHPGVVFRVSGCLGISSKIAELILERAGLS
ncbi:MAG TPA: CbiX/SirB N-terminal domain-containing protein [Planctomycetota bacterium]|nr:CbiX/SirB N-terminal domain-containing protein [Planctomycetota bacterium]